MSKRKVNPKWYRHESLHTTHVITDALYSALVEHMYFDSEINPEFNKHIQKSLDHLNKAYQACNKENEVKSKIKVSD